MKKIVLNIGIGMICIALLAVGSAFAYLDDDAKKEDKANKAVLDQTYPNNNAITAINARLADIEYYQQTFSIPAKDEAEDTIS